MGDEIVGCYSVAVRVMSLWIMGGVIAASAALPWLARAYARGAFVPAALKLTTVTMSLGTVGVLLILPFRRRILGLFGDEFTSASTALVWLLGAALAVPAGAPLLTAVVAAGRSARSLRSP